MNTDTRDDDPLLSVEGLVKHYDQSDGFLDRVIGETDHVRAVDGVDLTAYQGEILGIVGESGCGKSTLAETIIQLQPATKGTVLFQGTDITDLSDSEMRRYRQDMQIIFQDPLSSLNPRQTVAEVVRAPLEVHDVGDDSDRRERAVELLERVGLKSNQANRYAHQLSGGQQQRVAIARALALEPELLIADEPVSSLDVSVQAQILTLLEELRNDLGLTILFIAHDLSVVRYIADRVTVMYLGEIVERGPVEALFESPQHPYTRSLLSAVPRIDPGDRSDRIVLRGSVPSPINPPEGCRFHTRCPVVIPPPDWQGTPEEFEQAFEYRNRILTQEIDVEAIQDRLRAANETVDRSHVVDTIIDQSYPGDCSELPGEKAEAVEDVARAIAAGDHDRGRALVREAFPSPCEAEVPDSHPVEGGHSAACHRAGPRDAGRAARGR